ncbi:DcrB-related protein, partial [Photorhabdus akhurstii]
MENTPYQMNEGSLTIPGNWRDESMNVFVLPDDSGINLVVSRTPVPAG